MKNQKILYGAGKMSERAFNHYTKADPTAVYCFADTYKGGTEYLGKPVLAFDDFLKICNDYEVIICIFDCFDVFKKMQDANFTKYTIWHDDMLLSPLERFPKLLEYKEKFGKPLESIAKPRLIYGTGLFKEVAPLYYGEENITFADNLEDLPAKQDEYDITISAYNYESNVKSLQNTGVLKFSVAEYSDDYRIAESFTTKSNLDVYSGIRNREEVGTIDFIKYPELVAEYRPHVVNIFKLFHNKQGTTSLSRSLFENQLYGHYEYMKKYANRTNEIYESPAVEHSVWFSNSPLNVNFLNSISSGKHWKSHKMPKNFMLHTVGPYIRYAESFYNDELYANYKNQLGRNLLVFPMLSLPTDNFSTPYYRQFVDFCLKQAKGFNSITVCSHYNSINNDTIAAFRAEGANIVCAGAVLTDFSFVKRLKTIITAADAVVTDGIGTHIAFCLGLDKPIKSYLPQVDFSADDSTKSAHFKFQKKYYDALNTEEWGITAEQLETFEEFCGFTQTKTKEEMGAIFDLSKRIMQNADYKCSKYADAIRYTYRELSRATAESDKLQFRLMKEALAEG
ncbi:MAG: hypothetical protein FWG65_11945 [Turicibacter sp.]|nr:hypothetical protein [Turicibacter sp.]